MHRRDEWRRFFREFLANPIATAAIAPSSAALADRMLASIDWGSVGSIVEYGPGTGSFTREVLRRLQQVGNTRCRFLALELNPRLARQLAADIEGVTVREGDASDVARFAKEVGFDRADYVISGLGWPSIKPTIRDRILEATRMVLGPGGEFRTFGYHIGLTLPGAWGFRRTVRRLFDEVHISPVVWRNIPPAFVYTCRVSAPEAGLESEPNRH